MSGEAAQKRLGAAAMGLGVLAGALALYAVHGSMGMNAIALPGEKKVDTLAWAPEAWGFFTRDPHEETITAYVREGGSFQRAYAPGASPRWVFGLDRRGRLEGAEIALVAKGLGKADFHDCEREPVDCAADLAATRTVTSPSPRPMLCGDVAIVLQKPVPWMWARHGKKITMPSRVARLEVQC